MQADQIKAIYGPYKQKISKNSIKYRVELRGFGSISRRRNISFSSQSTAKAFVQKIKAKLSPDYQLDRLLDRFEAYMTDKGNETRSIQTAMKRLYSWFDGSEIITEITPKVLQKIYNKRVKSCAVDTQRNELNQCKTFFRWIVKQKILKDNPALEIEPQGKRKTGKDQLRIDEARRWMEVAATRANGGDKGAVAAMISLYIGARANEIVSRRVRDIDDNCRLFWIPSSKTESGKRIVEVNEFLQPFLKMLIEGKKSWDYLFPTEHNSKKGHVWESYVNRNVQSICDEAGVQKVCAHSMRGLHATLAEEYGVTGHAIAKSIGHVNIGVTHNHYTAKGTVENMRAKKAALRLVENG